MQVKLCTNCKHSTFLKGPNGAIDFNSKVCVWGPPSVFIIPTPQGLIAQSAYPGVAKETEPCHQHEFGIAMVANDPEGSS